VEATKQNKVEKRKKGKNLSPRNIIKACNSVSTALLMKLFPNYVISVFLLFAW
jgi:hypothetical protein